MAHTSEIAIGANKGHKVTKLPKRVKPSHRKGHASRRVKFVRDIIKEVTGQAHYEKRAIEYLKVGKDKKCTKFLKARLGTMRRAKQKRDELSKILLQMKRQKETTTK